MTVREEPSPLTGGPRRRPGRHHRPRRSDPRRASRAWSRAPAQKQRPRRRTTSGRGGQGPRSPGSSSAEAIGGARGSSRRHHGTEAPENGAAAIGSGGRGGGRPAPRSGGGRERSRFAPPARGQGRLEVAGPLPADGGSAAVFAADPAKRRPTPGRRRPRERAGGAHKGWRRRGGVPAVSRARGRGRQRARSDTPAPGTRDGAPRGGRRRPRASPPRDPCTAGRRLHVIPRRAQAPPGARDLHGNRPAALIISFVHKDN